MDLINRYDAIDALEEQLDYLQMLNKDENPTAESKWYGVNWARNTIADLPSAERKGKWEYHGNPNIRGGMNPEDAYCSVCGFHIYTPEVDNFDDYNYCPNCGADMRPSC